MQPALAPGDKVLVSAALPRELRPGDIVVRKVANARIAHRLIGSYTSDNEVHLITKGDSSLKADDAWPATQLVGKVIAIEQAGQWKPFRFARASVIALLSRCQLSANWIEPEILRRITLRILRAGLRVAVWTTQRRTT